MDKGFIANIFAGLVDLFGKSNLDKANKELKRALADESKTLEDIQNLLHELGEKYELNREGQAKLMNDNGDAIKALILKYADENFRPSMLFAKTDFEDKKFTIEAPITLSTLAGPIQTSQKITLKLDEKLTVKDGTTIAPLKNESGKLIANGRYDSVHLTLSSILL